MIGAMKAAFLLASAALALSTFAWSQGQESLTQAQIDAALAAIKSKAEACAAQHRGAHGKVVIAIKVGPNGEVQSSSVASNAGAPPAVASCVAMAARSAQFPPNKNGTTINYPFTF